MIGQLADRRVLRDQLGAACSPGGNRRTRRSVPRGRLIPRAGVPPRPLDRQGLSQRHPQETDSVSTHHTLDRRGRDAGSQKRIGQRRIALDVDDHAQRAVHVRADRDAFLATYLERQTDRGDGTLSERRPAAGSRARSQPVRPRRRPRPRATPECCASPASSAATRSSAGDVGQTRCATQGERRFSSGSDVLRSAGSDMCARSTIIACASSSAIASRPRADSPPGRRPVDDPTSALSITCAGANIRTPAPAGAPTFAEVALEHLAALHADHDADRAARREAGLEIRLRSQDRPAEPSDSAHQRSIRPINHSAMAYGDSTARRRQPERSEMPTRERTAQVGPCRGHGQADDVEAGRLAAAAGRRGRRAATHERISKQRTAHDEVDDRAFGLNQRRARAEAGSGPGGRRSVDDRSTIRLSKPESESVQACRSLAGTASGSRAGRRTG